MLADEVLAEATNRLVKGFHPDRIILFGSQMRGTASLQSDVDLLVITSIGGNRYDLINRMTTSLGGLGVGWDVVVLSPDEYETDRHIPGTIARPAHLEGKVLYERAA